MKIVRFSFAFLLTFAAIAVLSLTGRRKGGILRAEAALTAMKKVHKDIFLVSDLLESTNSSLDTLIKSEQIEFNKAFYNFEMNVIKITGIENNFRKHMEEMKNAGNEYFAEWQKEENKYINTDILGLSIYRRSELKNIYVRIAQNKIGVKDAFRTYVSEASEIKMYLSNDLTKKGIDSISHLSEKVIRDGENFRISIINLQQSIENLTKEMLHTNG